MAAIPVSEAAFAGFELVRRKPMALLVWSGVYFLYLALTFGGMFAMLSGLVALDYGDSDPASLAALPALMMAWQLAINLGSFVMQVILMCAVYRAVFEPQESRFGYLRIGKTELMVGLVYLCLMILIGMLFVGAALIGAAIVAGAWFASKTLAWLLGAVLVIGFVGLLIWVALRLSIALPMTFAERRVRLFESWALTKGQAGNLFLMMLLVVAVILAIEIVVILLAVVVVMVAAGAGLALDASLWEGPSGDDLGAWLGLIAPLALVGLGVISIVAAALHAVTVAPWAVAYRALTKAEPAPAEGAA